MLLPVLGSVVVGGQAQNVAPRTAAPGMTSDGSLCLVAEQLQQLFDQMPEGVSQQKCAARPKPQEARAKAQAEDAVQRTVPKD